MPGVNNDAKIPEKKSFHIDVKRHKGWMESSNIFYVNGKLSWSRNSPAPSFYFGRTQKGYNSVFLKSNSDKLYRTSRITFSVPIVRYSFHCIIKGENTLVNMVGRVISIV